MKRALRSSALLGPLLGPLVAATTLLTATSLLAQQGSGQARGGVSQASQGAQSQGGPSQTPNPASTSPAAAASGSVAKDPQGQRGISPFWEEVVQGDAAFIALDFASADAHYRKAITLAPQNPVAHLRMAELSIKQNNLEQAEEFLSSALRFSSDNLRTKAQAMLLIAGLQELKQDADAAIQAYSDYKALDSQLPATTTPNTSSKGPKPEVVYVATADQRTTAIQARKELEEQYKGVVERIRKNVEAADQATGSAAGN